MKKADLVKSSHVTRMHTRHSPGSPTNLISVNNNHIDIALDTTTSSYQAYVVQTELKGARLGSVARRQDRLVLS